MLILMLGLGLMLMLVLGLVLTSKNLEVCRGKDDDDVSPSRNSPTAKYVKTRMKRTRKEPGDGARNYRLCRRNAPMVELMRVVGERKLGKPFEMEMEMTTLAVCSIRAVRE